MTMTEKALAALEELAKQRERTEASTAATKARLDALERGTSPVSKAERAAAELDALVERDLDRRPVDERGRPRTREMALLDVVKTRRGSAVVKGIRSEGRGGELAIRKVLDMDRPAEPERATTAGERRLEELAKAVAKADGISVEQATAEVVATDEGRAAYASHRVEVAART